MEEKCVYSTVRTPNHTSDLLIVSNKFFVYDMIIKTVFHLSPHSVCKIDNNMLNCYLKMKINHHNVKILFNKQLRIAFNMPYLLNL